MDHHGRCRPRDDGRGGCIRRDSLELDNDHVYLYKKITSGATTPDVLFNLKGLNPFFNSFQVKDSLFLLKSQYFYQF